MPCPTCGEESCYHCWDCGNLVTDHALDCIHEQVTKAVESWPMFPSHLLQEQQKREAVAALLRLTQEYGDGGVLQALAAIFAVPAEGAAVRVTIARILAATAELEY